MSYILKFALAISFLLSVVAQATPLHTGYIHVKLGSIEEIKKEVIEHSKLTIHEKPMKITVHLWDTGEGVYVSFPNGTTTYNFINLISWLNYPPGKEHIGYSKGWFQTSTTKNTYFLFPDEENERGDTLIGVNNKSESIRIYLPAARISLASKKIQYEIPPTVLQELVIPDLSFEVYIDINPDFGNPSFVLTDQMDSNWGY